MGTKHVYYVASLSLKLSAGQVVYAHQFVNLTGENLTDTSLFEEHLCSLMCDLTGLALSKYSKVGGVSSCVAVVITTCNVM